MSVLSKIVAFFVICSMIFIAGCNGSDLSAGEPPDCEYTESCEESDDCETDDSDYVVTYPDDDDDDEPGGGGENQTDNDNCDDYPSGNGKDDGNDGGNDSENEPVCPKVVLSEQEWFASVKSCLTVAVRELNHQGFLGAFDTFTGVIIINTEGFSMIHAVTTCENEVIEHDGIILNGSEIADDSIVFVGRNGNQVTLTELLGRPCLELGARIYQLENTSNYIGIWMRTVDGGHVGIIVKMFTIFC